MRKLLTKKSVRQLKISEYLFSVQNTTLVDLSSYLNSSEKTIRTDIRHLNELIAPIEIIVTLKTGIFMNIPQNYSIDYIYSQLLKDSLEFSIIEFIAFNENYNINQLSEQFYISEVTLKRMFIKINKEFVKLHIQIQTRPSISLVGNEENITFFLYNFMKEKYLFPDTIFSDNELEAANSLFFSIKNNYIHDLSFSDLLIFSTFIIISSRRVKNNHFKTVAYEIKNNWVLQLFKTYELTIFIENCFNLEFNSLNINNILWPFLENNFIISYSHLQQVSTISPNFQKELVEIDNFLTTISTTLNIKKTSESSIKLNIFNTLNFNPGGNNFILHDIKKVFVDSFSKRFYFIIPFLKTEITKLFKLNTTHTTDKTNEIIYILTTHWPKLIASLEKIMPKIKIGLYFNYDIEYVKMIQDKLDLRYPNQLAVYIITDFSFSLFKQNNSTFDLIFTNIINISSEKFKVLCISNYPTNTDWIALDIIITQLQMQKFGGEKLSLIEKEN